MPAAFAIPGGRLYQPADYSGRFSGPVRVRYALANSLNVPAVHVLSDLGVSTLLHRLHDLGFTHLDEPASYYGLGLTLGGGEVSLWELVGAYVAMARNGDAIPLHLVDRRRRRRPREIGDSLGLAARHRYAGRSQRARPLVRPCSVLDLPFPAAVKTGTSSDFRDTWTVGFTRDYTVGVWVGNFDGSPMRGVSGVTGAGPLWNRIMLHLYERDAEPPPFSAPRGFVRARFAPRPATPLPGKPCPVVREWARPAELAQLRTHLPAERWRIVFPHDGDRFIVASTHDPLQRREQSIALQTAGTREAARWSINGEALVPDADGTVFLPLRLGTWRIVAAADGGHDEVTIHVDPPYARRAGFTFTAKR